MLSAAKIDESSSLILGKRKAFEDASKSFPMMKPMGERKNNNKRGYWGRDERFLNKNKIKNKKMNKKNKKTQNLQSKPSLVLATPPKLERDFKRQVVEVFEYFGIGKTLSDRLKNNMFFRSRSPSKMKTTRIKDLKAIATAVVLDMLNFIHPEPERVMGFFFNPNYLVDSDAIKKAVLSSQTCITLAESYRSATSMEEKREFYQFCRLTLIERR